MQSSYERLRLPVLAAVVVILVAGARYEGTQALEAELLTLLVPLAAVAFGFLPLRHAERGPRIAAAAVALVVLLVSEAELGRLVFPPEPLARVSLSEANRDQTLPDPGARTDFEVETRGSFENYKGSADERFVIDLERGGVHREIEGRFEKSSSVRVSRRRAPTQTSSHTVDDDLQTVSLPGSGPIHAHLTALSGSGPRSLELNLRGTLPGERLLAWVLGAAIAGALVVGALAVRGGEKNHFVAWIAIAAVLALYLPHHFSRSDPLGALVGSLFVAGLGGGLGGWVISALLGRWLTRDAHA